MDRNQVMNLVSDGGQEYLQAYQPPVNDVQGTLDSLPDDVPPSPVSTDATLQHANSAVSDLTWLTIQRQMDMMQTMMSQVCQLVSNNNPANPQPR